MRYLLALLICIIPTLSFAAPASIDAPTMGDKQITRISGTAFGTKIPAAPILWDDFESGVINNKLSTDGRWTDFGAGAWYTSEDSYSGSLAAHNRNRPLDEGWSWNQGFVSAYHIIPEGIAPQNLYYSYMSKYTFTGDERGVYKSGRASSNPEKPYEGAPGSMALSYGAFLRNDGVSSESLDMGKNYRLPENQVWVRHEMYQRSSSSVGVADGSAHARIIRNGIVEEGGWDNIVTKVDGYVGAADQDWWRYTTTYPYRSILLGLMFASATAGSDADHRMYVDDVYVDRTQKRVELCDSSTWATRTKCDIQIPTAWSTTEITVVANVSSFVATDPAYLYVFEDDGTPLSTNGLAVTIGNPVDASCDNTASLCLDETACNNSLSQYYWYNNTCNASPQATCTNNPTLCLIEVDCTTAGWDWNGGVCEDNWIPPFDSVIGKTPFSPSSRARFSPTSFAPYAP